MSARSVDINAQFAKLCPSSGAVSLEEKLDEVNGAIKAQQSLSDRNHWAACSNRLAALYELQRAIHAAINGERRAA